METPLQSPPLTKAIQNHPLGHATFSVPQKKMNPAMQEKLEKQRKLLSELLFPAHVPKKCHARVESMVQLLQDLNSKPLDGNGVTYNTTSDQVPTQARERRPFTPDEWDKMRHPSTASSFPFSHKPSPLQRVNHVDTQCGPFLRRAEEYNRQLRRLWEKHDAIAESSLSPSSSSQTKSVNPQTQSGLQEIHEKSTRAKIYEMNYRYCIAQTICPERMTALRYCWDSVGPEAMKQLAGIGGEEFICRKEREAVERCCGGLVQSLMRDILD